MISYMYKLIEIIMSSWVSCTIDNLSLGHDNSFESPIRIQYVLSKLGKSAIYFNNYFVNDGPDSHI